MKKLHMGTDVIDINDAIHCVQKNIEDLSIKKHRINLQSYAAKQILSFYEEKIASQSATLTWLKNAL